MDMLYLKDKVVRSKKKVSVSPHIVDQSLISSGTDDISRDMSNLTQAKYDEINQ